MPGHVCDRIKTKNGLAHHTIIPGRVGIYFDDNPVVMTNTVNNQVIIPNILISPTTATSVCANDSVSFTTTTESIREPHYQWQVNGVNAGVNSSSFTITTPIDGSAVRCLLYNPAGDTLIATSNTDGISVSPLPVAGTITGASAVCEGATISLTASLPGGTWTAGSTNATVLNGVVTGVAAGTVVISYSVSNICGTAVTTRTVTVNPLPYAGSISGSSLICYGESITLTTSVTSGSWSIDNSNAASVSNGIINGLSVGDAVVSYTVTNNCGIATATHALSVVALPNAGTISGNSTISIGGYATFNTTGDGGTWSSAMNKLAFTGNQAKGVAAGADTVNYTVTNDCGSDVARMAVTVSAVPPQIYFDPASDVLSVSLNGSGYSAYTIINSLGQLLVQQQITGAQTTIDIKPLPAGVYRIRFTGNSGTLVKTFTKM